MAIPAFRLPPAGRIALALTLLLVAACAGPQKPPARTSAAAAAPAATASGRDTPSRTAAAPKSKPSDGNKIAALVPPPPPPPLPNLSAGQFIGQGPDDLVAMLGEPRLIRRDYPAEIWQYVRPGCVLLVFLYESTVDPQRVWYLEMHDGSVSLASLSTVAQRTCLQDLYKSSRQLENTNES